MDFLGITSRECDQSSARFLEDMVYKNTSFAPVVNSKVTRARTPFLPAPETVLFGVYPGCKRTPHSNVPFQTFPSPLRHNAILRGAPMQLLHSHLSWRNSAFQSPKEPWLMHQPQGAPPGALCSLFFGTRGLPSSFLVWLLLLDHRSRCGSVLLLLVSALLTQPFREQRLCKGLQNKWASGQGLRLIVCYFCK